MIKTQRCLLKKFERSHSNFYYELVSNEKVREFLGGIPSDDHIQASIQRFLEASTNRYWIVEEKKSQKIIGFVSLDKSSELDKYEISYEFLPEWWGLGLAFEVVSKVLEEVWTKAHAEEIIAITQARNSSSRKLLEKVGMKMFETRRMFGQDQIVYILRPA